MSKPGLSKARPRIHVQRYQALKATNDGPAPINLCVAFPPRRTRGAGSPVGSSDDILGLPQVTPGSDITGLQP